MQPRILVVAGEPSADVILSNLLRSLRKLSPSSVPPAVIGVAGEQSLASPSGLLRNSLFPASHLSHLGLSPSGLLRTVPRLIWHTSTLLAAARDFAPHVAVFVDGKGFSRRVAPRLPAATLSIQYVAPSVWAWKGGASDVQIFGDIFDHMLLLFPFEQPYWESSSVPSTVVGSPAVEEFLLRRRQEMMRPSSSACTASEDDLSLLVMLGSRRAEVARHGPLVTAALRLLPSSALPTRIITPAATSDLRPLVSRHSRDWPVSVEIARSGAEVFASRRADLGLLASGTATLEAALSGIPSVVIYQAGWVSSAVAQSRALVRYAAIPNIMQDASSKDPVMRELLFSKCTPRSIADALLPLLVDSGFRRREARGVWQSVKHLIPVEDLRHIASGKALLPSERAAQVILNVAHRAQIAELSR
jgi:lipid-A-disaccharide synthase